MRQIWASQKVAEKTSLGVHLVQRQACSGEAAFDEAGLVLDLLQAVPG